MATNTDIDALYESTLKPRLESLEGLRREVKGYVTKAGLLVGVPAVILFFNGLIGLALPSSLEWVPIAVGVLGLFVGVGVAGVKYLIPGFAAFSNYRVRFKHEVAAEVFKIVCPTASYAPLEGIAESVFDEPGLFSTRGGFKSDDRVRGRIGQTPFEAADISRSYSTGGKNSRTVVVFRGLFFHLDFNKSLRGVTLVDPDGADGTSIGDRSGLTRVTLENPAFDAKFSVWASDEVEARYILTPAMMERILALQSRTEKNVHLGFKGNRAYLGVNYGRALFEPGIAASTSVEAIHEMAAHFALADGIVHELDLNTRIWTKGVDDSLLHAVDDEKQEDALDVAARAGNLTATSVWEAAVKATGGGHDDTADADAVQPSDTSIAVDRSASGVVINYGLGLGFFVAFGLWAVCVALMLAAARALPQATGMHELAPYVAWIPEIPYATPVAATLPLAWFFGGAVVGFFTFLMWAVRVRKVEIAPDAVRIWRGLRPVPRTYARPLYGKIVRMDKAVYVGKSGGFAIVNASASPMLSAAEAPWIAKEMRRALRETAR
jgi:Protein of unknown function (DUF3137)